MCTSVFIKSQGRVEFKTDPGNGMQNFSPVWHKKGGGYTEKPFIVLPCESAVADDTESNLDFLETVRN